MFFFGLPIQCLSPVHKGKAMKDHLRLGLLVLAIAVLLFEVVEARSSGSEKKKIPSCHSSEADKIYDGDLLPIDSLPSVLLVARSANHVIVGKGLEFQSRQNFVRPKSELICGSQSDHQFSVQLTAPTIIDLSTEKKVGDSFWIFQLMSENSKLGMWNQKSRLLTQTINYEQWLKSVDQEVRFYQIADDQFALLIKKKEGDFTHQFLIQYDTVSTLGK